MPPGYILVLNILILEMKTCVVKPRRNGPKEQTGMGPLERFHLLQTWARDTDAFIAQDCGACFLPGNPVLSALQGVPEMPVD